MRNGSKRREGDGVHILCLLRHGTMARRCAAGCHSSQAQASATGGSGIRSAKTRGMEALGYSGNRSRFNGGAQSALLRLGDGGRSRQACGRFRCSKGVAEAGLL
jgi:hypothetical protein